MMMLTDSNDSNDDINETSPFSVESVATSTAGGGSTTATATPMNLTTIPTPTTTTRAATATATATTMIQLPDDFSPRPFDVICSRGKTNVHKDSHPGNIFYRALIDQHTERYATSQGKIMKTVIVSEIIDTICEKGRSSSNDGDPPSMFVKRVGGKWFDIGDSNVRERVGQSLRDKVQGKYKSSSKSKRQRRQASTAKMIQELDDFITSDSYASQRIRNLTDAIQRSSMISAQQRRRRQEKQQQKEDRFFPFSSSSSQTATEEPTMSSSYTDDSSLLSMMTEANRDILKHFVDNETVETAIANLKGKEHDEGGDNKKLRSET